MKSIDEHAKQNIDSAANRVSSLPQSLLRVLAFMSEGMSIGQIALKLGYKNTRTVSTLIYEVNKRLGLAGIVSRQEKRQLAIDAFKQSRAETIKVPISPNAHAIAELKTITLNSACAGRIRSLLRQGFEIEAIEMILRKPAKLRSVSSTHCVAMHSDRQAAELLLTTWTNTNVTNRGGQTRARERS